MMAQILIPCKECDGTGLGIYPNECTNCNGTGVAQQVYDTTIKEWFDAFKKEVDDVRFEIKELKKENKQLNELILCLLLKDMDEDSVFKIKRRIDQSLDYESRYRPYPSDHDPGLLLGYKLEISNGKILIRFVDSNLTLEEEIAKEIIE